jgi:hypothetical protein
MFSRWPVLPVYATLFGFLLLFGLALSPNLRWWAPYAPAPAAALTVREAAAVVQSNGCAEWRLDEWRTILRAPDGARWFAAVTRDALTPAGRVYGLAGLWATDRAAFDSVVAGLPPAVLGESVAVIDSSWHLTYQPLVALLPDLRRGTLTRLYADTTPRPEC